MRVGLTREQVCFLDKLITKIRFSTGKKLTRSQVLKALFDNVKGLPVDVRGLKSEKDLTDQFLAAFQSKV